MTLIVEDGTLVANANSYVSLADARTFAASRGITLTGDDQELESYLLRANDYLEAQRGDYQGSKVAPTQALQWPRYPVSIDGYTIASDVIPNELIHAQIIMAANIAIGIDPFPTATGEAFITREKIGPIETEYSSSISTSGRPIVSAVDALLAPLMMNGGSAITTLRA